MLKRRKSVPPQELEMLGRIAGISLIDILLARFHGAPSRCPFASNPISIEF